MTTAKTFHVPAHPGPSSVEISRRMSGARRRDTAAEVALRSQLFRLGLRYRVALKVPGRPRRSIDVAFPRAKVAVFVDGCFWHGCLEHGTAPRSNASWWQTKLQANKARDDDTTQHLESLGWIVLRFWEHEPPEASATAVARSVAARRAG